MPVSHSKNETQGELYANKKAKLPQIEDRSTGLTNSKFRRFRANNDEDSANIFQDNDGSTQSDLCKKLLVNGFVQSFIDFYNLAHFNGNYTFNVIENFDDMKFFKSKLIQAEVSRRQGSTAGVFASYKELAAVFVSRCEWVPAIFFYEKFLEISQLAMDVRAEMLANHELGCVYYNMHDLDNSLKYHLRHEELGYSVDLLEEVAKANTELFRLYIEKAHSCEKIDCYDNALKYFQLSLEASKKCWDRNAEAEANGSIGGLLLLSGMAEQSIPYLTQQATISADMGSAEGRCRASSALAYAYDLLNQSDKAITELTLVHAISSQDGDIILQSKASRELGILYSKLGRLQDAVDSVQRHFQLLLSISEGELDNNSRISNLETARCLVGISQGNLLMGRYILKIQNDFLDLIDWKIRRKSFK